ncbi:hypothetical protein MSPP1_001595 [Malassezia sp. CBS 17886]|nr:hypothetical protein MSPP1_001595 [Malassezia sp. CBS 17886]
MLEKYDVSEEVIGHGTFAIVCMCTLRKSGAKYAVKIIARKPLVATDTADGPEMLPARFAENELKFLMSINNPMRLQDVYETQNAIFIVTDYCEGGDLFTSIQSRTNYYEDDARAVMVQLLDAVTYLHEHNIVHRDLKPENILLRYSDGSNRIVVTDFGLAKLMPEEGLLLTSCGSPEYVAPEVLLGKGYNKNVDLWSCGAIAFALLCGYTPFYSSDNMTLFHRILNIDYSFNSEFWSEQSELSKDFIRKCLCPQSERMSAQQALQHPWIVAAMEKGSGQNALPLKRARGEESDLENMRKAHVIEVGRLEDLQALRRSLHSTSEESLARVDKFVKHFKDESLHIHLPDGEAASGSKTQESSHVATAPRSRGAAKSSHSALQSTSYTQHYVRDSSTSAEERESTTNTQAILDKVLEQFKTTKLPEFSRIDPTVQSQEYNLSFSTALRLVPALLNQGLSIGSTIVSHAVYGPPKKSWGVEMSILTKAIREISKHSDLTTIPILQKVFELARFLPIPDDGLITPVTFRVKRRNLRGFLASEDANETGKRELSGEWIVGKQTWRRLQSDWQSGKRSGKERVILYVHGGAYFVMSAQTHRPLTIALSKYCECRAFVVNYRLAPDTVFPGALLDTVYAYFRLIDDLHIPPNNIVVAADSAGGGLAIAMLMYLRDNKYPLPGGGIFFSPWVDLTISCDSWETNKEFDYLPRPPNGDHMNPVWAYLGPNIKKYLTHPYVSPLFGDARGLPPLLIQSGDAEVLRDENVLFAHKCSQAGVPVRHEIYEDCVHVFQFFLFLDASRKALQSVRHFMRTALDRRPKRRASNVTADARKELDNEMSGGMGDIQGHKVEPKTGQSTNQLSNTGGINGKNVPTISDVGPSDDDAQTWKLDCDSDSDQSAKKSADKPT